MRKLLPLLIIVVFVFSIAPSKRKTGLKKDSYSVFVDSDTVADFLISKKPVTNREYLLYLIWTSNVYGIDYPEQLYGLIPFGDTSFYKNYCGGDSWYMKFSNAMVAVNGINRACLFNPKYLDYPVLGLNEEQALKFLKWLSDRYNESVLIDKKIMGFFPEQVDEENFCTEPYLFNQYNGLQKKNIRIKISDRLFVPSFRLPTKNEIKEVKNLKGFSSEFKEYPFSKKHFLRHWNNYYIKEAKDYIVLIDHNYEKEFRVQSFNIDEKLVTDNYPNRDMLLDQSLNTNYINIDEILKARNIEVVYTPEFTKKNKDSLGQFPYYYLGENKDFNSVYAKSYRYWDKSVFNKETNLIVRYAASIGEGQISE